MVWTKFLLSVALVIGSGFGETIDLRSVECSDFEIQTGLCGSASNEDDKVNIYVEETYVGDPGPSDSYDGGGSDGDAWADGGEGGGDGSGGGTSSGLPPFTPSASALASPMSSLLTPVLCRACGGGGGGSPTRVPGPPTSLTISDVLTLAPADVTLIAEPSTWSIVGSHTNFYTSATQHSAAGSILGHPVTVTFTPTSYRWDYGDGASQQTTAPGASWAALGQEDFTATPTSHVYSEKTTVQASVTVTYAAVVTLASGASIPVNGTLNRASTAVTLQLFSADTVITVGDCNEHPQQPRC